MTENLGAFLKQATEKYQDKIAFEIKRGIRHDRFTFAQMYDLAVRLAAFLKRKGVKKGDKIVILAPNMPEYVLAYFGSWLAGIVVVPIDLRTKKETIAKLVKLTSPKLGLTSKYLPHPFADFKFPTLFLEDLVDKMETLPQARPSPVKTEDVAEIVFTSGTTGVPKGVVLTHRNLLFDIQKALEVFPMKSSWRALSILPLSHAFAQVVDLLACFASGIKVVYLPRMNALSLRRALAEHQVTCMAVVPQILAMVLKDIKSQAQKQGRQDQFELAQNLAPVLPVFLRRFLFRQVHQAFGGKFKFFICGSAPLDLKLACAWENMGIKIYEGYGATEMTAGLTLNTPRAQKLGSVGKVLPGMAVKIDKDGEIWAKGDNISLGYFKNPQKTAAVFVNGLPAGRQGWYKSGDVGSLDKDGFLYLAGRTEFKIVLPSGLKVYPEDVEKKLKNHPLVVEACVVGVKQKQGEVVHAVVVTPKPDKLNEIIDQTNKKLADHQQILEVSVWPQEVLPKTPILKIDRKKILAWVEQRKVGEPKPWPKAVGEKAKDELVQVLANISQVRPDKISSKTNLGKDLKLDSLGRIELISALEEEMGIVVDEQKINAQTTVGHLRQLLKKGEAKSHQKIPLWPFKPWVCWVRELLQRFLAFPLHGLFVKIEVVNKENLALIKPATVFYFNHLGPNDGACIPRVLPRLQRRRLVILTDTLGWKKWGGSLGYYVQLVGGGLGLTDKGKVRRSGLEAVGKLVADGFSLLISPEGQVSKTGKLGEFKPGVGMLAVELRRPVLPIKISQNYQEIFKPAPFGKWQNYIPQKRGKVTISIGKPLFFPKESSYLEATAKMRREMEKL